ncbi:MAG: AIR synthase-related protein, partial [Geminicoccaceae bacterium]
PVDLGAERRTGTFLLAQIAQGHIHACHDLSDGGLAVAAAEMCLASGSGATLAAPDNVGSVTGWWFGEDQGRYLLAVPSASTASLLDAAATAGVIARIVGRTGGDALIMGDEAPISMAELRAPHQKWLPSFMAAEI